MAGPGPPTPVWTKFVFGGLSGIMATTLVHPFDLLKTRMQLSGEGGSRKMYKSSFKALLSIYKNDGFFALYAGYTGGVLRQMLYATTRLGVYNSIYSRRRAKLLSEGRKMHLSDRLACGTVAGLAGAVVGNPAEVVLIRMTSDGRLPPEMRRNYRNAFVALYRIVVEEGPMMLFKGMVSALTRAIVHNGLQLGMYSQIKVGLLNSVVEKWGATLFSLCRDGLIVHGIASLGAGFISSLASLPLDTIKTRIQTMRPGQYKGMMDCARKLMKKEGIAGFWKGFIPYYLRVGPHTILTFVFLEQMNLFYGKYFLPKNPRLMPAIPAASSSSSSSATTPGK